MHHGGPTTGDNDNLIDITTLTQLNGIRYDLDGNGLSATGDDAVSYYTARFPGHYPGYGLPRCLHRLRAAGRPGL